MNDKNRKAMFAKKKLKYEGTTVENSWNTEDFQTRPDTLAGADIDTYKPFWEKQIDSNHFVDWKHIPLVDQKKISRFIISEDNRHYDEEKERKLYHTQ